MQVKYFLLITLVLMITGSEYMASCHILSSPSSDVSISIPTCMKMLTAAVIDVLCPKYGAYGDYSSEEVNVMSIPREISVEKWETRKKIIEICCTKPCSVAELMKIC